MEWNLQLPERTSKPRQTGLTVVNDMGLWNQAANDFARTHGRFVDLAKIGIGSAAVEPWLREKILAYQQHDIAVYFGGTLFEAHVDRDRLEEYVAQLRCLSVSHIEVSCGTVESPLLDRCRWVAQMAAAGFTVLSEIGSKDVRANWPPVVWIQEIRQLKKAGAWKVILEGRDSGTAGIFTPGGELRMDLIETILEQCDPADIIFECPVEKRQSELINRLGANVNVGNVAPDRVLVLETQRLGLRYETFGHGVAAALASARL